jgi:dolichyl-phosphate-mannose--protein O-mannosyl transferase
MVLGPFFDDHYPFQGLLAVLGRYLAMDHLPLLSKNNGTGA